MAETNAASDLSCNWPALPALTNSRVICRIWGGVEVDASCAAATKLPVTARDSPNRIGLIFMEIPPCSEITRGERVRIALCSWSRPNTTPGPTYCKESSNLLIEHLRDGARFSFYEKPATP